MSLALQRALWTVTAGSLCAVPCALLGTFLVLRRLSLLGDAISHAVLPGIVVGALWSGSLAGWPVFAGAIAAGLAAAWLTQGLNRGGVAEDASLGIVFSTMFAVGVVLISLFARDVHIDTDCVLYGEITTVWQDRVRWGSVEIASVVPRLAAVGLATVLFIGVGWKELKLAAFDAPLADALGFSSSLVHYALMLMVAVVTVAAFEAVGSILVIALMIVPPVAARLWCDRLAPLLVVAAACGVLSAVLGYLAADHWDTSVSGMMAVAAGGLLLFSALFAPRRGVLAQAAARWSLALRIAGEDLLARLYRETESRHAPQTERTLPEPGGHAYATWVHRAAAAWLRWNGLVARAAGGALQLTPRGEQRAASVVRSHRLWESYLDRHFALPKDHLHEPASRIEHFIGPELQQEIAQELSQPGQDPHGRAIPQ